MEIKHFVFGKFLDLTHDFDIRIISPGQDETAARTMAQRISKLNSLCTLPVNGQPYIEYIGRLYPDQPGYTYVRFIPAANNRDEKGRTMIGFYHALLFNEQELEMLDMKPWKCRDLFIKGFDDEKITGWDHQVWLRREDLAHLGTSPKRMRINLDQPLYGGHAPANFGVYAATDTYVQYIATANPYSTLEDTDSQTLLRIFNAGIVLHYPMDSGHMASLDGMAKFVSGQYNLSEEFKKNNWRNLSVASIRSYVSSFKPVPVKEPAQELPPDNGESLETGGGRLTLEADETWQEVPIYPGPPVQKATFRDLQKQLLTAAFLISLAGMGILTWKLYHKDNMASTAVQKINGSESPTVGVVKPASTEPVPSAPPPATGERVSKAQYDSLRNNYIKLKLQSEQRNEENSKLANNNAQLTGKVTALTGENTGLKTNLRRITDEKEAAEEGKKKVEAEISSLKNQQRKDINAMREHIVDSLGKVNIKLLTDSIKTLHERLKLKPPKNHP